MNLDRIAELSGYSPATVSRVLNGKAQVKEETRERILAAARSLNYRPNLLVRGLQTGRTGMIGVMAKMGESYFSRMVQGIHDTLASQRCVPLLQLTGKTPDGNYIGISEIEQLHAMIDRRVDGVIMLPVDEQLTADDMARVFSSNLPLVLIDRDLDHIAADYVGIDDEMGGRLAAEYLLRRGCRRLGHIAGPAFLRAGRQRRDGFVRAARAAGAEVTVVEDKLFGAGYACMRELWAKNPQIDAVFAANDNQAAAAMDYLREIGKTIPNDVRMIGFSNLDFCERMLPKLTTVDQRAYAIGCRAAQMLLERIESGNDLPARKEYLAPQIVERDSA